MSLLRVSHRQQQQTADCLAACAFMVLTYQRVACRYEDLLRILNIRAYGTTFTSLRSLAALGVDIQIDSGTLAVLRSHLNATVPPIVFVNTGMLTYWSSQTGHAVVVTGIDEVSVYVHDPAISEPHKAIPIVEFEMAWIEQDQLFAAITRQS